MVLSTLNKPTSRFLPFFTSRISPSSRTFSSSRNSLNTSSPTGFGSASSSSSSPSSSSSTTTKKLPTTHYRITLRRSAIGLPSRYTKILEALGLHKRLSSVYQLQTPQAAGAILAVKELVHVDNVRRIDSDSDSMSPSSLSSAKEVANSDGSFGNDEMQSFNDALRDDQEAVWVDENGKVVSWGKEARKAPKGYRIVGSLLDERRNEEFRKREEYRKSFGL